MREECTKSPAPLFWSHMWAIAIQWRVSAKWNFWGKCNEFLWQKGQKSCIRIIRERERERLSACLVMHNALSKRAFKVLNRYDKIINL